MKQFKHQTNKINHDIKKAEQSVKDNKSKIKQNKQLPWLVSNVVEILELEPEVEDQGAVVDTGEKPDGTCLVVKTSTRNTVFLPVPGLVDVLLLLCSRLSLGLESLLELTKTHTFCQRNYPQSMIPELKPCKLSRGHPNSILISEVQISRSNSLDKPLSFRLRINKNSKILVSDLQKGA